MCAQKLFEDYQTDVTEFAPELRAKWHSRIASIGKSQWDACAADHNQIASYDHLTAMEISGAISREAGLEPNYLTLHTDTGEIQAAAPAFIKTNSKFELGMDLGWSLAYQRYAGDYYPKLQIEIPFHPISSPRFFVRQNDRSDELKKRLISELVNRVSEQQLSSMHVGHCTNHEQALLEQFGFTSGGGIAGIWENRSYGDFEDFLSLLKSSKYRNSIRRERRALQSNGISCKAIRGNQITDEIMFHFSRFYENTYLKYDQEAGLSENYFLKLKELFSDNVLMTVAYRDGLIIGAALSLLSKDKLATLHWGAQEQIPYLHFEVAYYQPIEYAISNGIQHVDAIDTAEHKTLRGFVPMPTYHSHFFRDENFHNLISENLRLREKVLSNDMNQMRRITPLSNIELT